MASIVPISCNDELRNRKIMKVLWEKGKIPKYAIKQKNFIFKSNAFVTKQQQGQKIYFIFYTKMKKEIL